MTTTPSGADAIDAQESRNYRLAVLYHQDGRQSPDHPMHGLYTGLVQPASTTTPPQENAMNDEFMFLTLPDGQKIAIRKSSVTAVFPAKYSQTSTIIEYLSSGDGVVVNEGFDKVCTALGIAPQQKAQPSEREINAVEALRRLRQWGGVADDSGVNGFAMNDVVNWIDKGMRGPLPPLPDYLVLQESVNYSLQAQP